ncbi:unnamed protein product [Allacma fusca]|uniref:Fe2OG dioxygenase domain-containing protein n=1 Tax=Allacma fusca TaxID=39272 RepID=A0A8J2KNP8_9HEXA|nr:unnamed protein product [Allacma fusca]
MKQGLYLWICTLTTVCSIVFSLNVGSTISGETRHLYATFPPHLEDLGKFELKIAKNLTQSLLGSKLLPIRSTIRKFVHRYLVDFYQSTGYLQIKDVIGEEQTGASNYPICAYRLIRRSWLLLKNLIAHRDFQLTFGSLRREIVYFFWRHGWPLYRDYKISAEKVLTIQHVYNFESGKLAQGLLLDIQTNCTLSSTHCYEMGNSALKTDQFTLALEWLELAKEKSLADKKTSVAFTEFLILTATDEHNFEFDDKKKDLRPTFYNRKIRYIPGDSKMAQKVRNMQYNKFKGKRGKSNENFNYWGLCSGNNFQTDEEKSFLFCWLEFKLHPGLTIGPLKLEFLARNPDVLQVYDILEDKQLEALISDAKKIKAGSNSVKTMRGQTNPRSKHLSNAEVISWPDGSHENVFSEKIAQLSGLKDISSEIQIESYSFGGHYMPRKDQLSRNLINAGDDGIAYFIFNLNNVDNGGYTAFPSLGMATKPVKGSVVFWYSQYSGGKTNLSTNHGSCPVLCGQKWVAIKRLRLSNQLMEQKYGPTQSDLEAAMFGVLNIQNTHNLDIKNIVKGIVAGVNTGVTLNARDCWNIGKHCASVSYVLPGLKWLEHALYLVKNGSDVSVKYAEVYDDWVSLQVDYECATQPEKPICHGDTSSKFFDKIAKVDNFAEKLWSMCQGKTSQAEREKSELFCWYEREIHPSYKIAPIKAEWLSLRPKADVVYFHDIISDRLMNFLMNFTYENATGITYTNELTGELFVDPLPRQVVFAWAYPDDNEVTLYASKLAERITGLKIKRINGPGQRMTLYAPGGHRAYHHDSLPGMQVATFMFYFSDVAKGGETPFISSGFNVVPRKGSAVFWYNLFTDGLHDDSTDHGGCPVIIGEKWASIRWTIFSKIYYFFDPGQLLGSQWLCECETKS